MVNRKQIAKKFILLSVLILFSAGLYIYARVFAKALDSGLALTYPVAMRILGRSAASLLGMAVSAYVNCGCKPRIPDDHRKPRIDAEHAGV